MCIRIQKIGFATDTEDCGDMKRYAGDYMTAYVGFTSILFIIGPVIFMIVVLTAQVSVATICLSGFCICCSVMWGMILVKYGAYVFSWCELSENEVIIKTWFKKPYIIRYDQCSDIGIGFYIHGVMNSSLGSKHYYIYLSYGRIDESLKSRINHLVSSKTCLKIGYNRKTYEYLLQHLPKSKAISLKADAKKLSLVK